VVMTNAQGLAAWEHAQTLDGWKRLAPE